MAGRLNPRAPAASGALRRAAFVLLVLAVAAVHGCVGEQIATRMAEFAAADPMPARIEVAYVRELAPSAPPAVVAPRPVARQVPATAARPASAPQVVAPPSPGLAAASTPAADAAVAPAELASAGTTTPDAMPADAADLGAAFGAVQGESWLAAMSGAASDPTLASKEAAAFGVPSAASAAEGSASGAAPRPGTARLAADAADSGTRTAIDTPVDTSTRASASASIPPGPAIATAASQPGGSVAASPSVLAAPASAAAPGGFEWPVSTRISYALEGNYRGEVLGSAQVEWIRVGPHYQVHLDVVIGASFAPLITRRMSSDGAITTEGLVPHRYDQDTRVMLSPHRRVTLRFEPGTVVLANGQRRASMPGVQDSASQYVQLTYLFSTRPDLLRVGNTVRVPLALPHKVDVWTYDVVEAVTLHTSFGPLDTLHLVPRRRPESHAGELRAEIWFAPQLRYLPVRFRIEQDSQTFIELTIARRPELAGS
ncbi:MAG: DUF3108 domain-containing protein [Burkholderiaceae bacterium]